jgi:hypothetical protein
MVAISSNKLAVLNRGRMVTMEREGIDINKVLINILPKWSYNKQSTSVVINVPATLSVTLATELSQKINNKTWFRNFVACDDGDMDIDEMMLQLCYHSYNRYL